MGKRIIIIILLVFFYQYYLAAAVKEKADSKPTTHFLSTYHDNYFLFHGFGKADYGNITGDNGSEHYARSVKFQISAKYCLYMAEKIKNGSGLYFAYTQKSIWDLWNFDDSSPFLESNYKPEGFIKCNIRSDVFTYFQMGVNHESNGIGGQQVIDSRSWNRIYIETRLNLFKEIMALKLRGWYPFIEDGAQDNSLPSDYMGYGELNFEIDIFKKLFRDSFGINSSLDAMLRVAHGAKDIKTSERFTVEVNLKIGPFENLKKKGVVPVVLFCQYFHGYGETLLKYDKYDQYLFRYGISLSL